MPGDLSLKVLSHVFDAVVRSYLGKVCLLYLGIKVNDHLIDVFMIMLRITTQIMD